MPDRPGPDPPAHWRESGLPIHDDPVIDVLTTADLHRRISQFTRLPPDADALISTVPFSLLGSISNQATATFVAILGSGLPGPDRSGTIADTLNRSLDRMVVDAELRGASQRWTIGNPDPNELIPGDVPAVRGLAAGSTAEPLSNSMAHGVAIGAPFIAAVLTTVYTASNYFVPPAAVEAVITAPAPPAELVARLVLPGRRVAVYFGRDVPIAGAAPPMSPELDDYLRRLDHDAAAATSHTRSGPLLSAPRAMLQDGSLAGLILTADSNGHLNDAVIWIGSLPPLDHLPPPANLDKRRKLLPGFLSRSALRDVAWTAAATCAWGAWHPPPSPLFDTPPDLRTVRRAATTGTFRRREPSGAVAAVRVLDLARTAPTAAGPGRAAGEEQLDRLSPVPHWRRPHLRRVRIGSHDDWRYETRQIAGTEVVPHGRSDPVRSSGGSHPRPDWLSRPRVADANGLGEPPEQAEEPGLPQVAAKRGGCQRPDHFHRCRLDPPVRGLAHPPCRPDRLAHEQLLEILGAPRAEIRRRGGQFLADLQGRIGAEQPEHVVGVAAPLLQRPGTPGRDRLELRRHQSRRPSQPQRPVDDRLHRRATYQP